MARTYTNADVVEEILPGSGPARATRGVYGLAFSGADAAVQARQLEVMGRHCSNGPDYQPAFRFSRSVSVSCSSDLM